MSELVRREAPPDPSGHREIARWLEQRFATTVVGRRAADDTEQCADRHLTADLDPAVEAQK
jgi:hypothetical protein